MMMPSAAFARQVAFVVVLYAVQGIPAGFCDNFLPLVVYEEYTSVAGVGLVGTLCAPWTLRFFFAPFIDVYGSPRFGKYKSWIVPLTAVMLAACACAGLAGGFDGEQITRLCFAILLFTFATGVEDCAVDGYAMKLLAISKRRVGSTRLLAVLNSAQVVGFKFGHLYAGVPVWWVYREYGWGAVWAFLAAPICCVLITALLVTEPDDAGRPAQPEAANARATAADALKRLTESPELRALLAFALAYKVPEKVAMAMYKPFLVDSGAAPEQVGAWLGTCGTVGSTAGSLLSALIVDRVGVRPAVRLTLLVRCLLFAASFVLPAGPVSVACQGLGSGIVTPAVFAYFMEAVECLPNPVTSYCLLQSGDDVSRFIGYGVAGYAAEALGYPAVFALACLLMGLPLTLVDRPRSAAAKAA